MDGKFVFYSHFVLSFVDLQHLRIQTTISRGTSDELEGSYRESFCQFLRNISDC